MVPSVRSTVEKKTTNSLINHYPKAAENLMLVIACFSVIIVTNVRGEVDEFLCS